MQGRIGYKVDYQKNVMIQQLKRDESVSHQVLLREAFPTSLQAIELSSETTNQLSRYSVQLSYTDFLPSRPALEAAI